ncbi:MAG: SDR family NAD(P)-dependent oxidoreductase [Actinomycetota bacterium]
MNVPAPVWVITGASSGIGRRTALDAASEGAIVCATARRKDLLRTLVEEMGGEDEGHSFFGGDVSERGDVRNLASHVEGVHGRCDVLVNNAGFNIRRLYDGPGAIDDVERIVATNFLGTVYCTLEFLPLLERSAPSSVVNVASVAGRVALGGSAGYVASKFAVVGWSESIRRELAAKGVYVSLVEPGLIPTEGFPQSDLQTKALARLTLGTTEAVAAAIRRSARDHKLQRVIPRWYYLLQVPRLLTPPLFRLAQRQIAHARTTRASTSSTAR